MSRTLTPQSNIEALRKEANRLRKAIERGDSEALARLPGPLPEAWGRAELASGAASDSPASMLCKLAALKQELEDRARSHEERVHLFLEKCEEAFLAAATRGDLPAIRQLVVGHPDYRRNTHAMFAAIEQDRAAVAELLLDLGMSPDIGDAQNSRALHWTTHCGAVNVAKLLIARGAEIDPCETRYGGPPLSYHGRAEMTAILAPVSRNFGALCFAGAVDRVRELLVEEPERANREERAGEPALFCVPDDEEFALELAELLLSFGADPAFRNPLGQTPAEAARRRGLDDVADLLSGSEAT
jgi:ankyrin repeat protein